MLTIDPAPEQAWDLTELAASKGSFDHSMKHAESQLGELRCTSWAVSMVQSAACWFGALSCNRGDAFHEGNTER